MANFISEDNIEQAAIKLLVDCHEYSAINCYTRDPEMLPDNSGRNNKKQVVLPQVLLEQLIKLNPEIPEETIKTEWEALCYTPATYDTMEVNYKNYLNLKNGIDVIYQKNGKKESNKLYLIDFNKPENNTFHVVSQMWIKGETYFRRPDLIIYVNGLPLVFIELKNSNILVSIPLDNTHIWL